VIADFHAGSASNAPGCSASPNSTPCICKEVFAFVIAACVNACWVVDGVKARPTRRAAREPVPSQETS